MSFRTSRTINQPVQPSIAASEQYQNLVSELRSQYGPIVNNTIMTTRKMWPYPTELIAESCLYESFNIINNTTSKIKLKLGHDFLMEIDPVGNALESSLPANIVLIIRSYRNTYHKPQYTINAEVRTLDTTAQVVSLDEKAYQKNLITADIIAIPVGLFKLSTHQFKFSGMNCFITTDLNDKRFDERTDLSEVSEMADKLAEKKLIELSQYREYSNVYIDSCLYRGRTIYVQEGRDGVIQMIPISYNQKHGKSNYKPDYNKNVSSSWEGYVLIRPLPFACNRSDSGYLFPIDNPEVYKIYEAKEMRKFHRNPDKEKAKEDAYLLYKVFDLEEVVMVDYMGRHIYFSSDPDRLRETINERECNDPIEQLNLRNEMVELRNKLENQRLVLESKDLDVKRLSTELQIAKTENMKLGDELGIVKRDRDQILNKDQSNLAMASLTHQYHQMDHQKNQWNYQKEMLDKNVKKEEIKVRREEIANLGTFAKVGLVTAPILGAGAMYLYNSLKEVHVATQVVLGFSTWLGSGVSILNGIGAVNLTPAILGGVLSTGILTIGTVVIAVIFKAKDIIDTAKDFISDVVDTISTKAKDVVDTVVEVADNIWTWTKDVVSSTVNVVKEAACSVGNFISETFTSITDSIGGFFGGLFGW